MLQSGTIKTLGVLIVALSIGTLILLWMERPAAQPDVPLQAVGGRDVKANLDFIHRIDVPFQYIKWRNIIVHDSGGHAPGIAGRCHFLIGNSSQYGDGAIVTTKLWRQQQTGNHIFVPGYAFEDQSVGVCILAEKPGAAPTRRQLAALIRVARGLQVVCQVPADRVYLHSELGDDGCPGKRFPTRTFRDRLISAAR